MSNLWDDLADARRAQIESGDDLTFGRVFVPYYRRLLNEFRWKRLIDVGCGTGHLLKVLRPHVEYAAGVDSSKRMVEIAKVTLAETDVRVIRGRVEEFTSLAQFDVALAHMTLQAVDDLSGFFAAVRHITCAEGALVFAIPHPCFWNTYQPFVPPERYEYMKKTAVQAQLSVRGKHAGTVPYIHRPLSEYFRALRHAGWTVQSFDEVVPSNEVEVLYGEPWRYPRYAVFQCVKIRARDATSAV